MQFHASESCVTYCVLPSTGQTAEHQDVLILFPPDFLFKSKLVGNVFR